jgi:hypothetical protein
VAQGRAGSGRTSRQPPPQARMAATSNADRTPTGSSVSRLDDTVGQRVGHPWPPGDVTVDASRGTGPGASAPAPTAFAGFRHQRGSYGWASPWRSSVGSVDAGRWTMRTGLPAWTDTAAETLPSSAARTRDSPRAPSKIAAASMAGRRHRSLSKPCLALLDPSPRTRRHRRAPPRDSPAPGPPRRQFPRAPALSTRA